MKRLLGAAALICAAAAVPPPPAWTWNVPSDVGPPSVPSTNPMNASKVELGRRLFYEADLSADGTMACSTCHEQRRGFADSNATRPGVHGDPGRRNAQGLANVAWLPRLTFADPAATSLEEQALIPLLGDSPVELGMKGMEDDLARRLGREICYRKMFRAAFPEKRGRIDMESVTGALAAFQRTMVAFDTPYDRYRAGDVTALTSLQRQGEALFRSAGCTACHSGPLLTDSLYHRLETSSKIDRGLVEKTGSDGDDERFRTPSLRNVAVSGPWWHDGSAPSLAEAVRRHLAPPDDRDVMPILSFMDALTDKAFLTRPELSRPDQACGKRL